MVKEGRSSMSALWSSRRQQVLSLVTGSSSLITAALLCSVTEFHPRENWFISLNYTLKQALSKSIKLIEKCPYHPIARFVFGPCVVDFSLMSSQAETALILLIEGLSIRPSWLTYLPSAYLLKSTEGSSGFHVTLHWKTSYDLESQDGCSLELGKWSMKKREPMEKMASYINTCTHSSGLRRALISMDRLWQTHSGDGPEYQVWWLHSPS